MPQYLNGISSTTVNLTVAAIAVAISVSYVFGPSLLPDPEPKPQTRNAGAVGLVNHANDCFINSVIQLLAGSPRFRQYLEKQAEKPRTGQDDGKELNEGERPDEKDADSESEIFAVTAGLRLLAIRLHQSSLIGRSISSRHFVSVLEHAYGKRISRSQQDAQEFLQLLLEKLQGESEARVHMRKRVPEKEQRNNESLPMTGELSSTIICAYCSHSPNPSKTAFLVLSLPVPQDTYTGVTTLDTCLDGLLKQEIIEGFRCEKCSGPPRTIQKHTSIDGYPAILIMHLSRSIFDSSGAAKNIARVVFKERLKLGGLAEALDGQQQEYRLVGLITHRGGHERGHYETFRRQEMPVGDTVQKAVLESGETPSDDLIDEEPPALKPANSAEVADGKKKTRRKLIDRWWGISDTKVRACSTMDVLAKQQDVYILLYEKT